MSMRKFWAKLFAFYTANAAMSIDVKLKDHVNNAAE